MNSLSRIFLAANLLVGFVACGGDDDPMDMTADPCSPVITAECTLTSYETTSFNFEDGDGNLTAYDNIVVTDRGEGTGTVTWTANNTYELNGLVFVNAGQTLTIEPGTVIRGQAGQGERASVLVVARGGRIEANGSATNPIIFTSVSDNTVSTPSGILTAENLNENANGLWGGVVLLGNATTNTDPAQQAIEGIPTSEERGAFGGSDDDDNSGTFRYVSIRHGGTDIRAGNEINGLTMGGVGRGTTIEYVEVFANKDDGFEWFGGTVNTRYLVSAFNKDDAMDYDMGWRGLNQFWLVYQDEGGDWGGEHDGGTSPETGTPFAIPLIANATYRGGGENDLLRIRDNAGGKYFNSIFHNFGNGVEIEFLSSGQDSYQQFLDGNLEIENNVFWNIDDSVILDLSGDVDDAPSDALGNLSAYFGNAGNTSTMDPMFSAGIIPGNTQLGPTTDLDDSFFQDANYRGAVEPGTSLDNAWTAGWTRFTSVVQ